MSLVMGPMIVLYFLGVALAALGGKGRRKETAG
jgi:Sec-independent protein secretion pathway component TatC